MPDRRRRRTRAPRAGSSSPASHWRPLTPNRSASTAACPADGAAAPPGSRSWRACVSARAAHDARADGATRGSAHRASRPIQAHPSTTGAPARARPAGRSSRCAWVIPVSSGLTTTTRSTYGSRIRATSQQLPVTSNATRSVGARLSASVLNPSGVLGTRPAERTFPSSQIATTQKSRCTSRPIARPTHLTNASSHLHQLVVDTERENQREKRHRPIRAPTLNPGKSQGRPNEKHGLEAHRQNGLPVCVLPRRPLSRINRRYGRSRTDPPRSIFMPRKGGLCPRRTRDVLSRWDRDVG